MVIDRRRENKSERLFKSPIPFFPKRSNALDIIKQASYNTVLWRSSIGLTLHFADDNVANGIMFQRDFEVFFNRYYTWNRRFLYVLGLWPLQSKKEQVFRICVVTFFQIPPIIYEMCWMFTSCFELERFYNAMQLVLPVLCFTCCYYTIAFNLVKLLYSRLKFDIEHALDKEEYTIVKKYANQSKWCSMIFMFIVYTYGVALASPSILHLILYFLGFLDNTQLTLPIPIKDALYQGAIYYVVLFYQAIVIFVATTTSLANYATFILLIQHACSQFSVISMKIYQPFEKNNDNIRYSWYDDASWDEYNWIVDIIKHYRRATEFINLINSLIENMYLVEIILGLFLIMLNFIYVLQFSSLLQNKREALMCCTFFVGSMFIVYLNFHVGQRLLDHSSRVFLELCNVPLYRISTKTQKLLLFFMMRSMKPCAVSIGGIFIVSHEFYASLMQKAASYAMACYTMR